MKRRHRTTHFTIWRGLALLLPLLFLIAGFIHYQQSGSAAPVQLAPPAGPLGDVQ